MEVFFLKSFYRDLNKIKKPKTAKKIIDIIEKLETCDQISEISGAKKMKGSDIAYRIRIGEYRIGLYLMTNNKLELSRVLHRKDIYKFFP